LSNFIKDDVSIVNKLRVGDKSKRSSTSSEGMASGVTFKIREEDEADGWKCLNFWAAGLTLSLLESVEVKRTREVAGAAWKEPDNVSLTKGEVSERAKGSEWVSEFMTGSFPSGGRASLVSKRVSNKMH
jgi:hypothetical protein